ncbi:MAG: HD domain-containing phosphohydrolase [Fimbriimonadaceae bacterium]
MTSRDQNAVIRALLERLEAHMSGERGHAERVSVYATATAYELGVRDEELLHVRWAAELHDVGKLLMEAELLQAPPVHADKEALRQHAVLAQSALRGHEFLKPALPQARHHHERFDGGGYPDGLIASKIPLGSRVIAVAEVFDVLTFAPHWRERVSVDEAIGEIERCAGTQFDPEVVEAFKCVQPLIQPLRTN